MRLQRVTSKAVRLLGQIGSHRRSRATHSPGDVFSRVVTDRGSRPEGHDEARSGLFAMTEPDLAQRLADDLDGNFEALVQALQGPVYRFAYFWCGNAEDAEEIAQDAFVRA